MLPLLPRLPRSLTSTLEGPAAEVCSFWMRRANYWPWTRISNTRRKEGRAAQVMFPTLSDNQDVHHTGRDRQKMAKDRQTYNRKKESSTEQVIGSVISSIGWRGWSLLCSRQKQTAVDRVAVCRWLWKAWTWRCLKVRFWHCWATMVLESQRPSTCTLFRNSVSEKEQCSILCTGQCVHLKYVNL